MKRSSLPFLIAAIIAVVVGFSFEHDPSLDHDSFESKFRASVHNAGFVLQAETSLGIDELPLPSTIQWHPRRWRRAPSDANLTFPDSTVRYGVARRGSSAKTDCYVRYLDGRAQLIEIRADRGGSLDASDMYLALKKDFAGFPVRIHEG